MKIALCFYGQLRRVKDTYETYIKPNIIDPNIKEHQIDVFVHTWWDADDIGKGYKVWGIKEVAVTAPVTEDVLDVVFKKYNPKKVLAERQIEFSAKDYHSYHIPHAVVPISTQSKCYSMKQVCSLKKKYEEENNFKYDWVANLRFDQGMPKPIDFSMFKLGEYNTSPRAYTPSNPCVVDCIVGFMDSDVYDYVASMYDYMDEYWRQEGVEFLEEHLLYHHLTKKGIPINRIPYLNEYELIR